MIEDEVLKWKFKCGSRDALRRIYEKYQDYLLTLAMALSNDVNAAEDVLHDVFVSFAESAESFKLRGSLKNYLATSVVNRARDRIRA
ncbi:MAG: RNA polymerase sigma factor, partial [Planctomycetota bacterium]